MRKLIIFIAVFGIVANSAAQQIPLKGVVSVQNSKTQTGTTQYVKNAEVTHPNAKNDVTDDDGKFTLNITGLKQNVQTQIAVILSGAYSDYVVVNEKELRDVTLGRVAPLPVYICKKGELEKRQAEMVGINMRKLEERMEKDKNRLQKELDALRQNNDYLNARYGEIKDSLDILSKNIDKAFERIKEYAKSMVLENLDDKDNNYVKAYACFSKGELDSVSYYLSDQELELKHQKILQLQQEAKKEKELAAILTESAKAKEEFTENSLNELIKEWLLLARTYNMKNDYEKTMFYYEKAIHADTSNLENIFEFAKYLHSIQQYSKAEKYYLQCLEKYRLLEKANPKSHLTDVARVLNRLAFLHRVVNEHSKAVKEYSEALEIRRKLVAENPIYLADLAITLNDFAVLHRAINEHQKSLEKYEEALEIRRKLAKENPEIYSADLSLTLNNLGILYWNFQEYSKALNAYEEALKIRRKLAVENPQVYLPDLAQTLNNLAILHWNTKEYAEAEKEYKEALKIRRELSAENPKAYLDKVAQTLNNLALLHVNIKEYPKALEEYNETLEIYKILAIENTKAYLDKVALILNNSAVVHRDMKKYSKALEEYEEALKIYRDLATENAKVYLADVALTLSNLAELHIDMKEYPKALAEYKEALRIYKEHADENPKVYLSDVVLTLNNLSWTCLFTKEYTQAEQYASEALKLDSTALRGKACIAHSLLLQGHYAEAETLYKELLQSKVETWSAASLLEDLEKLEQADAIPQERKVDVKIIKLLIRGHD